MAARRVFGSQLARCLPAAQGRDGHAQRRSGFTYTNKSPHIADVSIGLIRFKSICSSPNRGLPRRYVPRNDGIDIHALCSIGLEIADPAGND